ncbi:MAG: hypothetical protein H7X93_00940 [Sphingomonadaceae bacterium]|nr:hypothetical protein [Sphingomonadaceae bacterium]
MPLAPGLYRLAWRTPLGEGAGVVTLDNACFRALKGPAFTGRLHNAGDAFAARLILTGPAAAPVAYAYGRDRLDIDLAGRAYGPRALLAGRAPQAPGLEIEAELTPMG